MAFEELYLVSTRVAPVDGAAVDALLAECGLDPPGGYREFLTRFGPGEVCDFLRVLSPDEVRQRRREHGAAMGDEWMFESDAERWTQLGVTRAQLGGSVPLWTTNQQPTFFVLPGHGPRVFHWEAGGIACYERGMIDVIPAVARLMFDMSFPFFEPRRPGHARVTLDPVPGLELEPFVAAVGRRWGEGVRRLRSGQDDFVTSVFARPVQGQFSCWLEEGSPGGRVDHIGATYDVEHEGELHDFLKDFVVEVAG